MRRRSERRPAPSRVIRDIVRVEEDLTHLIRAKASGELPAESPVKVNLPSEMIPVPLDSAIARTRQLRQDILN